MKTPEIREEFHKIADELDLLGLTALATRQRALADELKRRPPCRPPAPPASTPMTEDVREAIRRYAVAMPQASQADIARVFGCNAGRVSESLAGFRQ